MQHSPPSGDVTLVFTDIEGSARASSQNETAFLEALSRHNALLEPLVEAAGGYLVKNLGDGYFFVFSDVYTATACLLDFQQRLQQEDFSATDGLRVRVGIHCAVLTPQAGDYFGSEVNLAQRISDAGHGDMILLSPLAAQRLQDNPLENTTIVSLGLHRLKNLSEPCLLFRLMHPALKDRQFPFLRTLTSLQHNFPAQLTAFIGRTSEMNHTKRLLMVENCRLITLTGMGGVGKSRIATQTALDSLEAFPGGMWRVEFADVRSPQEVPEAIAGALQEALAPDPGIEAEARLISFFREKQALLLLENFERVMEATPFVSDLIQSCPRLTILTTSQQLLQIGGEREVIIEPMKIPPEGESYETLLRFDSARLFVERASMARTGFTLTRENTPSIAKLCRELEGLPLSLELTASLVRALTPQQLVPQMSRRFRLIAATRPDLEPRLRSLRGAIDWSYELLTEGERTLYAELGVFVGGFSMEEVEAVCDAPDAFFLLIALRDKSLLKAEEVQASTRYLMLTTLREYALEKLEGTDRLQQLRERHAAYFLKRAEILATGLEGDTRQSMKTFALEVENMTSALKFLEDKGDTESASRFGAALGRYYLRRGPYAVAERLLEMAERYERSLFAKDAEAHRSRLAHILLRRGAVHLRRGECERAEICLRECLPLFEKEGDIRSAIASRINLGTAAYSLCHLGNAKAQWEAALALAQETKSPFVGTLIMDLALLEAFRGDYASANFYAEQALKLRHDSDPEDVAYVLLNVGEIQVAEWDDYLPEQRESRPDLASEARDNLEESLRLCEEMGNLQGIDRAQVSLGTLSLLTGDIEDAQTRIEAALISAEENDDRDCLFACLIQQGKIAYLTGEGNEGKARASHYWKKAFALAEQMQSIQRQCLILRKIAEAYERMEDMETAQNLYGILSREHKALEILPPPRARQLPPDFAILPDSVFSKVAEILGAWSGEA